MRWLIAIAMGAGACGNGDPVPHSTSAPRPTPPADARQDASFVIPSVPTPSPGTWPYVEYPAPCTAKVRSAPSSERAAVLARAKARLGHLGRIARITLGPLGDRVEAVSFVGARTPPRPPRTEADAIQLALAVWDVDGDVFGLTPAGRGHFETLVNHTGASWEVHGKLGRAGVTAAIASVGVGDVAIELDRNGRLVTASVKDILPSLTLCDAMLARDAVASAIAGTSLEWDTENGHEIEGKAEIANIRSIERTVTIEHELGDDGPAPPYTVTVVYEAIVGVRSRSDLSTYTIRVDPITAKVVSATANHWD